MTGSIGQTALRIIAKYPHLFELVLIANNENLKSLKHLIDANKPEFAVCTGQKFLYIKGKECSYDDNFLNNPETYSTSDIVINGISGVAGLAPSLAVIRAERVLATANKESLVAGGNILMNEAAKYNAQIRPLDSEHSSIWQCVAVGKAFVEEIILTASGGAFRNLPVEKLACAPAAEALKHPTWVMGQKITIDCATLMNKGMEIIEAKHLFAPKKISVVRHNESIIHSLVRLTDGSLFAHLSTPDMTIPIQYALTYPERMESGVKHLELSEIGKLTFEEPDYQKFPCLRIATEVNQFGDIAGCVMNAANEVLVNAYINDMVGFYDIPKYIELAMDRFAIRGDFNDIDELFSLDSEVREYTSRSILINRG